MAHFTTKLDVIQIDDRSNQGRGIWMVQAPLVYKSDLIGEVEVPIGFITDFASVPRIPYVFDIAGDRGDMSGTVHDYLYDRDCKLPVSRRQADKILKEALISQGVPTWIAVMMYIAVRLFARSHFRK